MLGPDPLMHRLTELSLVCLFKSFIQSQTKTVCWRRSSILCLERGRGGMGHNCLALMETLISPTGPSSVALFLIDPLKCSYIITMMWCMMQDNFTFYLILWLIHIIPNVSTEPDSQSTGRSSSRCCACFANVYQPRATAGKDQPWPPPALPRAVTTHQAAVCAVSTAPDWWRRWRCGSEGERQLTLPLVALCFKKFIFYLPLLLVVALLQEIHFLFVTSVVLAVIIINQKG